MKRLLTLFLLFIIIYYYGCGVDDGNEKLYRRQISVESNLPGFQLGNKLFDSTTVYPYVLEDLRDNSQFNYSEIYTIYPVQDTGYIKFRILGGEGSYPVSSLELKDTFAISTPVDTTKVTIFSFRITK